MAVDLAFDLIHGVGNENEILELSYATFAEELQLQEILKESMIASGIAQSEPSSSSSSSPLPSSTLTPQAISSSSSELSMEELEMEELETAFNFGTTLKEQEDAVAEATEKSTCPVCHGLSCTECTMSQGLWLNSLEQQCLDWGELGRVKAQSSGLSYNEQQRISWDEKGRENFMAGKPRWRGPTRHSQSKFNGRRMRDFPQITSSNEFHAKTCLRSEDVLISDTGNNQDPKGKGIAIDDDWLLVSHRKPNRRAGRSAAKQWGCEHYNPFKGSKVINRKFVEANEVQNVVQEDDYDTLDSEDDDSDTSQKSHESRKKSKWFKEFFERMGALHIEEIDETLWHCPACQGGPGAIKWYRSIQDLIAHAKKIGARRVKLHRQLAELLEEELSRKGTSITPAGQIVLGNWKGLKEDAGDPEIVWPPMVVIMNTMTNIYKNGKCIGMGSQKLLEHFSLYPALKAQHSYGPQGHRGFSVLIFESSAVGYLEAERLHKNFVQQGSDRFAWNSCPNVILPGGERQLYGFMAVKEDLDMFNQHHQGNSKIKYDLKSYKEVVLNEIEKMSEDCLQLTWLKDRLAEERKRAKTFEESVQNLSRNLQLKMNDIHIFQQRVQLLHQQNKEEMDSQENFYKDQIKILEAKVKELENLQESDANTLPREEPESAGACLMEEYTPYQYNSNLNVEED